LPVASGGGDMLKSENLSGLASYPTARTNLGLGTGDSPTFKNLTISTGTITTSAPVTISQTWNAGAVAFTALKVNAVSTASAAASLLLDLQVGGVSQFYVDKSGTLRMRPLDAETKMAYSAAGFLFYGSGAPSLFIGQDGTGAGNAVMSSTGFIGFASTSVAASGNSDTRLYRNSTAAQTFRVYNTYTSDSNYERLNIQWSSNVARIFPSAAGSGTVQSIYFGSDSVANNAFLVNSASNSLQLNTNGGERLRITSTGNVGIGTTAPSQKLHVVESTSNSACLLLQATSVASPRVDFLDAAATPNRWSFGCGATSTIDGKFFIYDTRQNAMRMVIDASGNLGIGTVVPSSKLHVAGDLTLPSGGSIFFGGGYNVYGTTTATSINGPTAFGQIAMAVNGSNKWIFNYDGLLCGGGTTASFPALKRSTTYLQARLADDSAFAPIQGKLTTDTAYTATTVVPTGFITLYDSTGAAYRVPCVAAP
jgi:hypothetical protein